MLQVYAKSLFCSLNLSLFDIFVAIAVRGLGPEYSFVPFLFSVCAHDNTCISFSVLTLKLPAV